MLGLFKKRVTPKEEPRELLKGARQQLLDAGWSTCRTEANYWWFEEGLSMSFNDALELHLQTRES